MYIFEDINAVLYGLEYEGGRVKDKYLSDLDAFLKADHGTAFDRTHFSRRKQGERRVSKNQTIEVGHIIRSGNDRRVLPDRRRSWKRHLDDKMKITSWEV